MENIGLSHEQIIKELEGKGIVTGEEMSASALRNAIADVIVKNNIELAKNMPEVVATAIKRELQRQGMSFR